MAQFLNSTDEPSLLASAHDPAAVSYRFDAWSGSNGSFRVIRFSLNSDKSATIVNFLVPGPIEPLAAKRPTEVDRNISAQDAQKFLTSIDFAGFWTMPTVKPPDPTLPKYHVMDGAFWVFEGVRNGAYHVVSRFNPDASPFTAMVRFLGEDLAGLSEHEVPLGMWPPVSSSPNHPVTIQISEPVRAEQPFAVRVVNLRSTGIYYCLVRAGAVLALAQQPVPAFDIQQPEGKKWRSLSWASDQRSLYSLREIEPAKGEEFFIKLSQPGRYRLSLDYIPRSMRTSPGLDVCPNLDGLKGAKAVTSEEFEVFRRM